jgi:Family of unknown function (DUF6161)
MLTEHTAHAKTRAAILFWYAVLGTALLGAAFGLVYAKVRPAYSDPSFQAHLLAITLPFGVLVTILFWIGRFLSRLYLSERHLAIDAKLRATMAKTYLALASNQKVDEKDRALVLAPLFRAGNDGLIQEDTGLDSGFALVARPGKGQSLASPLQ